MSEREADRAAAEWLSTFEAAVRARDFATGRLMFAPDAVAFGTFATAMTGLDRIELEQWREVWPRIHDFRFAAAPVVRTAGAAAWIAAAWFSGATDPAGRPFTRRGRATFLLERRQGRWLAVHSHVSLDPSQADAVHGQQP